MKIKKIFVLFTMLLAGLSFKNANDADKMAVADAADIITTPEPIPGTYAYLDGGSNWLSRVIPDSLKSQGVDIAQFKTLLITDSGDRLPTDRSPLSGCPFEVGLKEEDGYTPKNFYTNGCAVAAYVYQNETDATKFDCILYAFVETLYASNGESLFANLTNVETITFDCKFSMAKATVNPTNPKNPTNPSMSKMFYNNPNLTQIEGLINLDTTNVKSMSYTFASCPALTELNVSNFNTSNVTNMYGMFGWCNKLTTITGLNNFNTSNVTNMSWMFYNDRKLATLNLSGFDTSNVTTMEYMFGWCESLSTLDVSNFNTANVTTMEHMFSSCSGLTELNVGSFDTSNVTNMEAMFGWCKGLTTIKGLENFNTENVTDMNHMFNYCSKLKALNVSSFNTKNVTNMNYMFSDCSSLIELDLSNFNTKNVTDMSLMFYECSSLTTLNVSSFDTSNVTTMYNMFAFCSGLTSLDVSSFDTKNVTNMSYMFAWCENITTINGLEKFNTFNVTDMKRMFTSCYDLTTLDLSSFDLANATSIDEIINNMSSLKEIKVPKNLNGHTIELPSKFGMDKIDSSMEGWTLLQGSTEFNILYNTLMKINVCTEYAQAPELQAIYDGLSNEEKDKLASLTDNGGVILTDKLSYMVGYADYKANDATTASESHLVLSARTGQYLVIVIACLSLSLIGGYYFLQKKKYAK